MENRSQYRRLLRAVFCGLLLTAYGAVFWITWYKYYSPRMERMFWRKGHLLILGVYLLAIYLVVRIYNGWKTGYVRVFNIIFAQSIGAIITNIGAYVAIILLTKHLEDAIPLAAMTGIQMLLSIPWAWACNKLYLTAYPPRRVLMVYGDRPASSLIHKIANRTDRFTVSGKISINEGLEQVYAMIPQFEGVVICDISAKSRNDILKYCYARNIRTYVSPKISDIIIRSCESQHMFDTPMLMARNDGITIENKIVKRLMDIVISALLLLVTSPIMLAVAVAIKMEDHGSIFYKQERLTIHRKRFYIYKFRSMKENAEEDGKERLSQKDDDRITKVGRFIRATRLDELPQFINILKGEMSLVGPRPERPSIAEKYEEIIPEFAYRLKVKAGLTGYAQVYGKYNTTAYDKLKLDLMYIQNYRISLDIEILMRTLQVICSSEAAEGVEDGFEDALKSSE
ncbi:MAG TPA: exopolysaccharide biosynthesis polyprenyl glycosylphosphotransferase [Oribacterium sp.]|nr:exopolysaccharide biosynthesis polyprenyl glycosylphosphotransferase [Oribacterium sp.]